MNHWARSGWVGWCVALAAFWQASGVQAREPLVADAQLAAAVEAALQPGLIGETRVAVCVLDGGTGEVLLATDNAAEPFTPASNMKLLTSAATLDLYGPDHVLRTDFRAGDGTLIVVAGGDPAFGDPAIAEAAGQTPMTPFRALAQALHQRGGPTTFPGGVIVVDAVFDEQLVHPNWHPANLLHWYGAPVAGVSFNDNCVDVTFVPTEPGQPAELELVPPAGGFKFVGEALTVSDKDAHAPELAKRPGETVFIVGGAVARRGGPYSKPVDDPRRYLGEVLMAELPQHGIEVDGPVRVVTQLDGVDERPVLATHVSALTDVLGRVNTNSQNMMAEALAKLNGRAHLEAHGVDAPRGSWEAGAAAAEAFLQRIGIDTAVLVADDGSGLSRENRLSATIITELLLHMRNEHEHGKAFVDSMAISGVRGSVRNRLKDLEGKVYAKTGTIRGVSALSGYLFHHSGRVVVFSILHNGIEGSPAPYRRQQDDAVRAMAKWLDTRANAAPETRLERPAP